MSQLVPQIVSAAVVGALSPAATMATIAVLAAHRRSIANAVALLAGWTLMLIVLAGFMFWILQGSGGLGDNTKAVLNLIIGQLLISFGLRNVIGARHPLRHALEGGPHRHEETPHWMSALDAMTPGKALGLGAVLLLISPADLGVYLSALQGVASADVDSGARVPVIVALVVGIDLCILIPLAIYAAMPGRAARLLSALRTWLLDNERRLMAWVLIVFGVWLTASGAVHLI